MTAERWELPSLLKLNPEQAAAAAELTRFETAHPGVRILRPHYHEEPWRADIRKETVPGDDRAMLLTAVQPTELLGKLDKIFPAGSPPGREAPPGGG